jgi:hypothetical protein
MKVLTAQQCRIEPVRSSPGLCHQVAGDAFAGVTLDISVQLEEFDNVLYAHDGWLTRAYWLI